MISSLWEKKLGRLGKRDNKKSLQKMEELFVQWSSDLMVKSLTYWNKHSTWAFLPLQYMKAIANHVFQFLNGIPIRSLCTMKQ